MQKKSRTILIILAVLALFTAPLMASDQELKGVEFATTFTALKGVFTPETTVDGTFQNASYDLGAGQGWTAEVAFPIYPEYGHNGFIISTGISSDLSASLRLGYGFRTTSEQKDWRGFEYRLSGYGEFEIMDMALNIGADTDFSWNFEMIDKAYAKVGFRIAKPILRLSFNGDPNSVSGLLPFDFGLSLYTGFGF